MLAACGALAANVTQLSKDLGSTRHARTHIRYMASAKEAFLFPTVWVEALDPSPWLRGDGSHRSSESPKTDRANASLEINARALCNSCLHSIRGIVPWGQLPLNADTSLATATSPWNLSPAARVGKHPSNCRLRLAICLVVHGLLLDRG